MKGTIQSLVIAVVMATTASFVVAEEVVVKPEVKSFTLMGWLNARQQQNDNLPVPGDTTESWLAMQREGNMASENPQAATRELREKAAERFLKTYDQPIPTDVYGTGFTAD
jgi:hypothetical protein